jgi:starch synthase (maltosyl-transferring)
VAERRTTERRGSARGLERIVIECVTPELDGGRYAVKRLLGDLVEIGADVIKEGHDQLAAALLYRRPGSGEWKRLPMSYDSDTDRWYSCFVTDALGRWCFTVEAWTDRFQTWRAALAKKSEAGQDISLELLEGAAMVRRAARRAKFGAARATLLQAAAALEGDVDDGLSTRTRRALDSDLAELMVQHLAPSDLTRYARELEIIVDRPRAGFAAWYEMFPRSNGPEGKHGTFRSAAAELDRIAGLGFDVVYLPPIHPIGRTFRKGRNNTLTPGPDDVGSPWAIGSEEGGHTAVNPDLGTIADFDHFVERARELGMEIALDYALQCSPDHPWVKEHPDWFHIRPDGSIQYAENPPKKYQDIYPLDFWCEDREGLWNACRDVLLYWIEHGVKAFRVDNPHTKAWAFWEWVIREVQREHPDAIFFAEAFTRPKKMKSLAKLGFTMSYTYFTWKNHWWDLRPYAEELTGDPTAEYYRGNFFANTPDILNEYLVDGGRPAFRIRQLLAGTLSPLYGVYSGYELIENTPVKPGSEEYLDSEKYQLRTRGWDAPGNISGDLRRLNDIRRSEPALQLHRNLTFHHSENPQVLFYRKAAPGRSAAEVERSERWRRMQPPGSSVEHGCADERRRSAGSGEGRDLLIAVNLDPHRVQESMVHVPLEELGVAEGEPYAVTDLLTGARYTWRGSRNYVRLDPGTNYAHVMRLER